MRCSCVAGKDEHVLLECDRHDNEEEVSDCDRYHYSYDDEQDRARERRLSIQLAIGLNDIAVEEVFFDWHWIVVGFKRLDLTTH